jgi:catechol 2,3-dioxygenase
MMSLARVTGIRSVDLGVRDLEASTAFFTSVWGLPEASRDRAARFLRGTGCEHHIVALHERQRSGLLAINFAASDCVAVDALHAKAAAAGIDILSAPGVLSGPAGGGYGFALSSPEGQTCTISAEVSTHAHTIDDPSRPERLSHAVLNAHAHAEQMSFYMDLLGFRLSDATDHMAFMRCSADHHSIAVARANGPSLNHMAFEMHDFDGLMRASGRMKANGFEIEWGVGRHGPGNNIFTYFVEPNGFVTEYTTGMEQIDEATYQAHDAAFWRAFPSRPCRWGVAMQMSQALKNAMLGKTVEERNLRCEEVMATRLNG